MTTRDSSGETPSKKTETDPYMAYHQITDVASTIAVGIVEQVWPADRSPLSETQRGELQASGQIAAAVLLEAMLGASQSFDEQAVLQSLRRYAANSEYGIIHLARSEE